MSSRKAALLANATRIGFGLIALGLLAALLVSVFLSRGTIQDAEAAAETRAIDWANTVLFDALTPEEVQAPILGPDYRELLITVQAGIRSDDRTARVRIWNADGVLVFSDDQRDKIGDFVATNDPQIEAALSGKTVSVPTQATVAPKSGLAGSDEKLFQTFVPLRLENALGISGVVQIDQRYAAIEAEASDVWQQVRLALVIALTIAVGGFLFSLRARPAPAAAPEGAEGAAPAPADRRQLERAAKIEEQLRLATERAETAEATAAEAEASVNQAVSRPQELEERAEQAEERAGKAESALQEAAQRMTGGEGPRRGVPGVAAVAVSAPAEFEERLKAAEGERLELMGEIGRLRAALGEREAQLAIAREGASAGAELDEARALAAEHQQRANQLEQQVTEHAQRAAGLERQLTDLTKEAATAQTRVAELESQLQAAESATVASAAAAPASAKAPGKTKDDKKAASDLRAAQLQATELQLQLTEMQGALDEAKGAVAERERLNAELETAHAELEKAHAELEKARGEREAKGSDVDALQARMTKELEAARAELEKADAELSAAREALAGKETEVAAATSAAAERTAAVEGVLGEMEEAVLEIEARAKAAEARASQAEAERADLAAELDRVRAEASPAPASAEGGDLKSLRQQVAELESARRNDIFELQRAQESLANTQAESIQARRRVKELEEQLARVRTAGAEEATVPAIEEATSFASRLAHLVSEHEPTAEPAPAAATPAGPAPAEPGEVDESALSLRERLARAAAARHRAPGGPSSGH